MNEAIRHLVQRIHDAPQQIVLVTAGAGTQALSHLLGVPGATRTMLEALVPYSKASFDEYLGQTPAKYVTANTARLLAGRAFTRARLLTTNDTPVVGLACTATIVTDRPKKGAHRAHIATWQAERLVWYRLQLQKGVRDRDGEENVVSRLMLNALSQAFGLAEQLDLDLVEGDKIDTVCVDFSQLIHELQQGKTDSFYVRDNGRVGTVPPSPQAMLCGSFNPLHDGHLEMAQAAGELSGKPLAFELSVVNVDKPPLAAAVVQTRVAQFAGRYTICVNKAPTFVEKAQLYPETTFVVGYDTVVRILQVRYYQNNQENLEAALTTIRESGCHFLVAGRVDEQQNFRQLADLNIPPAFADLFRPIPSDRFRRDISSTALRTAGSKGSR